VANNVSPESNTNTVTSLFITSPVQHPSRQVSLPGKYHLPDK